jgi:predicted NBD/HSP70 family sugar kinase
MGRIMQLTIHILLNYASGTGMTNKYSNQTIKYFNQRRIITLLSERKSINQVDIAKEIAASLPTVISNVNELVQDGILRQGGVGSSRGGRKPVIVNINSNFKYIFGIDFLVDTIKIVLFNFTMEAILTEEIQSSRFINFDEIMEKLILIMKDMLLMHNITLTSVIGIGISIPGIVNEEAKNIEVAPNLHIKNTQLQKYNEIFGLPVYFENEANAACYAEWQSGAAKGSRNVIYLSIMKGVGAGIIINNQMYRGEFFKAGEIGHVIIKPHGRTCTCGEEGCLNEYTSVDSLLREYENRTSVQLTSLSQFMEKQADNDVVACEIWEEYIDDFVSGLKITLVTFDPKLIVIGGEIARYQDILISAIQEKLSQTKSNILNKSTTIVASQLMELASITGVALYMRNAFINKYKSENS